MIFTKLVIENNKFFQFATEIPFPVGAGGKSQHQEAKQRFQATFNTEPETLDSIREAEKARIQASNRLGQVENELKTLCEGVLPFAIAGRLFGDIRKQIDAERETVQYEAIRDNAAALARKIVRVVEDPEPIYREKLPAEQMAELEQRIFRLLQQGMADRLYTSSEADEILSALRFEMRMEKAVLARIAKELRGQGLDIFIGRTLLQKADLVMELNNTEKHANSHVAIMGKPGAGKTQFLLKILTDIRIQSNYQTHLIYFDYKGDVADNQRFLEAAKVQLFRLLQGSQRLPVNPFVLPAYDEQTIKISAREKAESFASINTKLGVVQKGALTEAIRVQLINHFLSKLVINDFYPIKTTP